MATASVYAHAPMRDWELKRIKETDRSGRILLIPLPGYSEKDTKYKRGGYRARYLFCTFIRSTCKRTMSIVNMSDENKDEKSLAFR